MAETGSVTRRSLARDGSGVAVPHAWTDAGRRGRGRRDRRARVLHVAVAARACSTTLFREARPTGVPVDGVARRRPRGEFDRRLGLDRA